MNKRGSVHDKYPAREESTRESEPINKQDRARLRIEGMARTAEAWLAKAEQAFARIPAAKTVLSGVRNEIRQIRADAQEQLLLAVLQYGKAQGAHECDALGAMVKEEGQVVDTLTRDPKLFEKNIGEMIQGILLAEVVLSSERLAENQRKFYEEDTSSKKRMVDVYLNELRKEAHQDFDKKKLPFDESVRAVEEEIKKSGIRDEADTGSVSKKETFLKRLFIAQDRRKALLNRAVNKHVQAVILERLIQGTYDTMKNPLKAAQDEYEREVTAANGASFAKLPPDMSFAYGFFAFDKADRLDHIEKFIDQESVKKPRK